MTEQQGPLQTRIIQRLRAGFPEAVHIEVINDSKLHAVPAGSETHFRVIVASNRFAGMARLARHRLAQQVIAEEASQAKAISLRPLTEEEFAAGDGVQAAPNCRGG